MPAYTIAHNAGVEGAVVVGKLLEQTNLSIGYDAAKGSSSFCLIQNLFNACIWDIGCYPAVNYSCLCHHFHQTWATTFSALEISITYFWVSTVLLQLSTLTWWRLELLTLWRLLEHLLLMLPGTFSLFEFCLPAHYKFQLIANRWFLVMFSVFHLSLICKLWAYSWLFIRHGNKRSLRSLSESKSL